MAISIKDIQEIEFPIVDGEGYDADKVDDFLDAIAASLGELVRENIALRKQLETSQPSAMAGLNEESYFKNLQSAMRDSLLSAQRVADETIAAAKASAEEITRKAAEDAEKTTADALAAKAAAEQETADLKAAAETYRAGFTKLVEDQLDILKAQNILFK